MLDNAGKAVDTLDQQYYCKIVELMRVTRIEDHYYNHYPWQTHIVFRNLLQFVRDKVQECKSAKTDIPILYIFSSDIDLEFFDMEVADSLTNIYESGCKVDIVLAAPPVESKNYWLKLKDRLGKSCVRFMNKYDTQLNHLWLFENAYRWEALHPEFEGKKSLFFPERPAHFAFNEKNTAEKIRQYFRTHIDNAAIALA